MGLPVAEAEARITEAEFTDWMLWFEWRTDMAERARKGLPMHDTDEADEMTTEARAAHLHTIRAQLQRKT